MGSVSLMKSPMIQTASYLDDKEKSGYSDLQVLKSAAGWYVGTTFWNTEDVPGVSFMEPGSRDSDYFASKEEAEDFLRRLEAGEDLEIRLLP
jgi:hypothetical protein